MRPEWKSKDGTEKDGTDMIGLIDADLLGRKRHRFPNLTLMKLSGYWKAKGEEVKLITDYDEINGESLFSKNDYDHIFMAKVFTDTKVPESVLKLDNLTYGGTGFYFDKAKPLPADIEHHMPDYHIYDDVTFINDSDKKGYEDYSVGFLTRGCFRHCPFCVNQRYNRSRAWSDVSEFMDSSRKHLLFLDDNFFACRDWKRILQKVIDTGKRFVFKQGLDERLLDDERAEMLFNSRYIGEFLFAFDNTKDLPIIREKLELARKYVDLSKLRFYTICGWDWQKNWGGYFWGRDIADVMFRINFLLSYGSLPYVTRFYKTYEAPEPYRTMYINIARWGNQMAMIKKMTLEDFCKISGGKSERMFEQFLQMHPETAPLFKRKYGE